jgi:hypothetical protein
MKKNTFFTKMVGITIMMMISSGCQKVMDYIQLHPTTELPGCQIRQFSVLLKYGGTDTLKFTYNSWGDPVSILRTAHGTGAPNFFFHYDKQHRLTESIGAYGNTVFEKPIESWNKYFYDASGQITKDSLYSFPDVVDGHPVRGQFSTISSYLFGYDTKGRILTVQWDLENGTISSVSTYNYDAKGNLAGTYAYDDKMNFRRTNKIWMFLDRNYSVNNPVAAKYKYNGFGLPVQIECLPELSLDFTLSPSTPILFTHAVIQYSCD